jgi:glycine betaine/choline ABC-type transport system substrate-binding protein
VPVVRRSAIDRWGPAVGEALDGLAAALTTDELRSLNRRVEDGEPITAVAASWLAAAVPGDG